MRKDRALGTKRFDARPARKRRAAPRRDAEGSSALFFGAFIALIFLACMASGAQL